MRTIDRNICFGSDKSGWTRASAENRMLAIDINICFGNENIYDFILEEITSGSGRLTIY